MSNDALIQSLWMLVAGLLYTLLAICIKLCVDTYSVYEVVFYRSFFGLFLALFLLRKNHICIRTHVGALHLGRNLLSVINLCLGAYVVWLLPLSMAQILNYTGPLFLAALVVAERAAKKEKIEKGLLIALALGFVGVLLIVRPDAASASLWAMFLGLIVGATSGSSDWVVTQLAQKGEPSERILFWFLVMCLLVGFVGTLLRGGFHTLTAEGLALLFGVGFFGTTGQYAMTHALKHGEALVNSVFQYSGVLFTVIAGVAFFGDKLDFLTLIGVVVICASGIMSTIVTLLSKRSKTPH